MRRVGRWVTAVAFLGLLATEGTVYMASNTVDTSGAGEGYAPVTAINTAVTGPAVYRISTPDFSAP